MTGALAPTLGRPGADAKPFGNASSPGMYIRRIPPDFIVNKPSSNPGITVHESNSPEPTQSTTRISFGLPLSKLLSKTRPLSSMAM